MSVQTELLAGTAMRDTVAAPLELSQAMQLLSGISENLSASYARLSQHARRVEDELVVANDALETKVHELDALRAHLEAILAALPMGVVVRDASGKIAMANEAACAILETRASELVGATRATETRFGLAGTRADGSNRETYTSGGRRRVIAERSSPIASSDGRAGASVQILDDRTELVELTERVHKQGTLAALGTMAAGIAHEIRNPMNAMLGFAELLKRDLAQHSREHRFASRISEGVCEVEQIIANMLSFAEPKRLHIETVDTRAVVESALTLVRATLPADENAPQWTLTHDVASVAFAGDRIKVRQSLRNLVANAVQAQPEGGAVHVSLEATPTELAFHVTDHGRGIPADLRRRLGDPFFTTRAEGTGLGLSLVHAIAELHGGRFEVCSHPPTCPHGSGRGAHVVFRIPQQLFERT